MTEDHPRPAPQQQLEFLAKIQRLLQYGQFTATYKFALLHALADLCVQQADDSGKALTLPVADIARQFATLYQRQAKPYPASGGARELLQNRGRQARVIVVLRDSARARIHKGGYQAPDRTALTAIDETIRDQPLWKLQRLAGGDRLDFLYENEDRFAVREIRLRPGVAYCFRAFHGLIVSMVRNRWEQWVRQTNAAAIDERKNLQEFLFGSERADLSGYREVLLKVTGRRCFYRQEPLHGRGDVDHFVPWSLYPIDLGHNFVLAHRSANSSKADALAAENHLERWLQQCIDHRRALEQGFREYGLPHDLRSSIQVVEWSYSAAERTGGRVWSKGKELTGLAPGWRDLVDDAKRELFPSA